MGFTLPSRPSSEINKGKNTDSIAVELFDDPTNLVSANLFYEHLERQIAQVRRDGSKFRIIKILVPDELNDEDLIDFAFALNESTRNEDVVARIGQREFLILLRLNPASTDRSRDIIKRVSNVHDAHFLFATTLIDGSVDSIGALELLDKATFKRSTHSD